MIWRDIPPQAAKLERLYGLGGWLGLLYAVHAAGAVIAVLILADSALDPGLAEDDLDARLLNAVLALAVCAPFLVLAPLKHPLMPAATIAAHWIGLVGCGALFGLPAAAGDYVASIAHGALAVLFTWYLLRSKRVNVTYRHRIPDQAGAAA